MVSRPAYVIVGRGAWAGKMRLILEAEGLQITSIPRARKEISEAEDGYTARLESAFRESGAQIAWLCVPPGAHVGLMFRAAIAAGLHTIAEKPWLVSASETAELKALAGRAGVAMGVHFEYCLLDEMERWRERFGSGVGMRFGGQFTIGGADRLRLPAEVNLGCHLLAMRWHAVPDAEIGQIRCAYEGGDERRAWLERKGQTLDEIDFTRNRQPIIQRFLHRFVDATEGSAFPFGLEFALRVSEEAKRLAPQTVESRRR